MPYRYIAILGDRNGDGDAMRNAEPVLRKSGLLPRLRTDAIDLFASEETPTLAIPGGNLLVGRVFREDGTPFQSAGDLPDSLDQRQLRDFLLKRCWGEYVLMQSSADDDADVIIMRDPSAGVPCVYSPGPGPRFATSDISLATHHGLYRKHIDWDFIARCLLYPHQMTQRTALTGVRELLPGCLLRVQGAEIAVEQAWSPWDFVATGRRHDDPDEAAAHVRDSVLTATRAWAAIDRSILLEISGGLDSSILAACLRGTGTDVSCCTLVTPVPGADERQYASLVASDLGVALHAEELGFELARFDAPPPTWSVAPRINILQHALNEIMTTVGDRSGAASHFSGGGGDTVFCYLGNAAPAADAFRERGISAGTNAIRELSRLHQCTLWKAARLTLDKLFRPPKPPHVADHTLLNPHTETMPHAWHPWFDAPPDALPGDRRRIQLLAGTHIYRHGMCRGASRDLRMPLLSQPVVEACLRAPSWMWIAGGRNRSVARAAFSDDLPREVLNRRSKGDFAQYLGAAWRRNKHQMRDFLLEGELQTRGLLAPDNLEEFFQRHRPPRDQSFFRVFDLCMIENWIRHQR
jgi:asparagine synthase (glutamine-hydrolysing)